MRVAVMQPYLFPYFGYFQLISSVDIFYILDDVNYINRGWINRNNICINGQKNLFTIPIIGASQNKKINQLSFDDKKKWADKLYKKIIISYKKSVNFDGAMRVFEEIISFDDLNLSNFISNSIYVISRYIGIDTVFKKTSQDDKYMSLKGEQKIINLCHDSGAKEYINLPGGVELYSPDYFRLNGIKLNFIKPSSPLRGSIDGEILSILDTLFMNEISDIQGFFKSIKV